MSLTRTTLTLHRPIQQRLEAALQRLLQPQPSTRDDFLRPHGEPALTAPGSVCWAVFKNPLVLFIGGVTAVVLELAEPRVRSGVWDHSSFRDQPLARLQRTGYAAMMTVYGPRSRAEAMILRVGRMHERVRGRSPDGRAYCAADPELLDWVHATAWFGFLEAHHAYVRPLDAERRDRFYAEGVAVARRYGALAAPASQAGLEALFDHWSSRLERSDIVFEFLRIARTMPLLAWPLRPLQGVLIKAAVETVPPSIRQRLGLDARWNLSAWQRRLVCRAARVADRLLLGTNPAVQACRRLGLPEDHLYGRQGPL